VLWANLLPVRKPYARTVQRFVSVHGQFGSLRYGKGDHGPPGSVDECSRDFAKLNVSMNNNNDWVGLATWTEADKNKRTLR